MSKCVKIEYLTRNKRKTHTQMILEQKEDENMIHSIDLTERMDMRFSLIPNFITVLMCVVRFCVMDFLWKWIWERNSIQQQQQQHRIVYITYANMFVCMWLALFIARNHRPRFLLPCKFSWLACIRSVAKTHTHTHKQTGHASESERDVLVPLRIYFIRNSIVIIVIIMFPFNACWPRRR